MGVAHDAVQMHCPRHPQHITCNPLHAMRKYPAIPTRGACSELRAFRSLKNFLGWARRLLRESYSRATCVQKREHRRSHLGFRVLLLFRVYKP
jgi:hypothetical protein